MDEIRVIQLVLLTINAVLLGVNIVFTIRNVNSARALLRLKNKLDRQIKRISQCDGK